MGRIVEIQLRHLERLLESRHMHLVLEEPAKAWLAEAGYDPVYGARPLKRVIQRHLQNPLASLILEGRIKDGETIRVGAGKSGLTINGAQAEAA
jgi:ATP-dependent Clp protease ATP-binding subunit ClpB